jgi:hypothetical protein
MKTPDKTDQLRAQRIERPLHLELALLLLANWHTPECLCRSGGTINLWSVSTKVIENIGKSPATLILPSYNATQAVRLLCNTFFFVLQLTIRLVSCTAFPAQGGILLIGLKLGHVEMRWLAASLPLSLCGEQNVLLFTRREVTQMIWRVNKVPLCKPSRRQRL